MERANNNRISLVQAWMSFFDIAILLPDKFSSASLNVYGAERERKMCYFSFRTTPPTSDFKIQQVVSWKAKDTILSFSVENEIIPGYPLKKSSDLKYASKNGLMQNDYKSFWRANESCYQLMRQLISALSTIVSAFRLKITKRLLQ